MRIDPRPERYVPVPASQDAFDRAFPALLLMFGIGLAVGLVAGFLTGWLF